MVSSNTVREVLLKFERGSKPDTFTIIRKFMQYKPRDYAIGLGKFASENLVIFDPINYFHFALRDIIREQKDLVKQIGDIQAVHLRSGLEVETELWERI